MNINNFPDNIAESAAAWIAAMDRGLSEQEQLELENWLAASHLHAECLIHLASLWDLMDVLRPISDLLPLEQSMLQPEVAPAYEREISGWTIAAGIAVLALGIGFSSNLMESVEPMAEVAQLDPATPPATTSTAEMVSFHTNVGQRSDIALEDGSQIKLNTDTELQVEFTSDRRRINLIRGEAFFDVSKDSARPFEVITRNSRVTVVGTAFGIDVSGSRDTEVVVTEGRVKVDPLTAGEKYSTDILGGSVVLIRGQKAQVQNGSTQVSDDVDIDQALAWREGRLIFSGESFAHVIAEIDRYTPLKLKLADQAIANVPVGGFFKTGDLEQLLQILEQNFGIKAERVDDTILFKKAGSG